MLVFIFWVLAVALYVKTGYEIARKSVDVWLDKDNASLASFLLFPSSHRKGEVGKKDTSLIGDMGDAPRASPNMFAALERSSDGNANAGLYIILNALFWPIRIALFNFPSYLMLGPGVGLRHLAKRMEDRKWQKAKEETARALSDHAPTKLARLLKEQAELDEAFRQLTVEVQRRRMDNENQLQLLMMDSVAAAEPAEPVQQEAKPPEALKAKSS